MVDGDWCDALRGVRLLVDWSQRKEPAAGIQSHSAVQQRAFVTNVRLIGGRVLRLQLHNSGLTASPDAKRLIIIRAVLALKQAGLLAAEHERLGVLLCMSLGRLERKPLDVSTIAAMLGQSRQAVLRKLHALEAEGFLTLKRAGRRTLPMPVPSRIGMPRAIAYLRKAEKIIRKAAAYLSETDT